MYNPGAALRRGQPRGDPPARRSCAGQPGPHRHRRLRAAVPGPGRLAQQVDAGAKVCPDAAQRRLPGEFTHVVRQPRRGADLDRARRPVAAAPRPGWRGARGHSRHEGDDAAWAERMAREMESCSKCPVQRRGGRGPARGWRRRPPGPRARARPVSRGSPPHPRRGTGPEDRRPGRNQVLAAFAIVLALATVYQTLALDRRDQRRRPSA